MVALTAKDLIVKQENVIIRSARLMVSGISGDRGVVVQDHVMVAGKKELETAREFPLLVSNVKAPEKILGGVMNRDVLLLMKSAPRTI